MVNRRTEVLGAGEPSPRGTDRSPHDLWSVPCLTGSDFLGHRLADGDLLKTICPCGRLRLGEADHVSSVEATAIHLRSTWASGIAELSRPRFLLPSDSTFAQVEQLHLETL